MTKKAYRCRDCGDEQVLEASESAPDCCGETMQEIPLDNCTKPFTAESARMTDDDDACDDGVH